MTIRSFTISLLVSLVFSMNLTSCGALPVSPTLTPPPTQPPTPISTPTQTETPTSIPTETLAPAEIDIRIAYEEPASGSLLGVEDIQSRIITDESLDPIITSIARDDSYKNYD